MKQRKERRREELWVLEFLKPKIIVLKKNKNFRVTKRMWKEGRMRMRRWQHFTNENYSLLQKVSERTTCLIGCEGNVWFFVVFLVCLEEKLRKGRFVLKELCKTELFVWFLEWRFFTREMFNLNKRKKKSGNQAVIEQIQNFFILGYFLY